MNTILTHEIIYFSSQVEEAAKEHDLHKELLIHKLKDIISIHLSCFDVKIYGSYATGLSLPSGDIDIVLEPNSLYSNSKIRYDDPLEILNNVL